MLLERRLPRADATTSDYGDYVSRLREVISAVSVDGLVRNRHSVKAVLDGEAAAEVKFLLPLDLRRELGAFFTGSDLRRKALSPAPHRDGSVYFDPACGAGDLLLEAAMGMPTGDSFEETVRLWSPSLLGCDVEPDFVEAAKLRLLLAAGYRTGQPVPRRIPAGAFSGLVVGDGLAQANLARRSNHILLNPPFGYVEAPNDIGWATGRVSRAAVFLHRVIEYSSDDMLITAILPDVLRSGTRYRKWRTAVETVVDISSVETYGLFDKTTDVDVFVLNGRKAEGGSRRVRWTPQHEGASVGDFFKVHVGPVVANRDPESGPVFPFIWPRRLPQSGSFDPRGRSRRFAGRTFDPPFVAIRRTSRPGQRGRAGGVLVTGDRPVAVENHLLVALPKDGSSSACADLIRVLADQRTSDWLDRRIRTRHLTVSTIRDLPWRENPDG